MPTSTFLNLPEEKKNRIIEASIDVFSNEYYSAIKLSDIIRKAKIPRGSFYQYFEDKKDLYHYVFSIIVQEKMKYIGDMIYNPETTPFTVLFRDLYIKGLNFALENPKYVMITKNLIHDGSGIYNELFEDNIELAREFYRGYINTDKKLGRIREDVDTDLLVDFVISSITNIAFDEIRESNALDPEKMLKKAEGIISILQKGIE